MVVTAPCSRCHYIPGRSVNKRMKKTMTILLILLSAIFAGGCRTASPKSLAMKERYFYSQIPRDIDEITIANPHSKETEYTIKGDNLFNELESIIEYSESWEEMYHGCYGGADIHFKRKGKIHYSWNWAHGKFFVRGEVTPETEKRLTDWFEEKGVPVFKRWAEEGRSGFSFKNVGHRALDYLRNNQNSDGFWGNPSSVFISSFALTAFLNRGETSNSWEYGKNIDKGFQWLMKSRPKNDLERVSAYNALAAGYFCLGEPELKNHAERIRKTFDSEKLEEPALTLYLITRPIEPEKKVYHKEKNNRALKSFCSKPKGPASLVTYLKTLNLLCTDRKEWKKHNRKQCVAFVKNAGKDGFIPMDNVKSELESTVFASLCLSAYYRYWNTYLNIKYNIVEKQEELGLELELK